MNIRRILREELYKQYNRKIALDEAIKRNLHESLILEAASIQDIYQKYYSDIDEDTFKQIIESDPTFNPQKPNKMGKYGKWLLNLYKSGNLSEEDLYKAKDYLTTFVKFYNRIENKDINTIKSLPQLYEIVKPFMDNPEQATSHQDEVRKIKEGAEKVYEDDTWLVIVPHTEEASCYYGKGTQWCTAATSSNNMFDAYNEKGNLYININKKDSKKYQFHFESQSFMDENDNPIKGPIYKTMGMTDGLMNFYKNTVGEKDCIKLGFINANEYINKHIMNGETFKDIFENIGYFYNGFARVQFNYYWNFIDKDGNILSSQWFDDVDDFNDDTPYPLAKVELNGDINFIDSNGKLVSDNWIDGYNGFNNGYEEIELNGEIYYVDEDGYLYNEDGEPYE